MIAHTLPSSLRVAGPPDRRTWTYYTVALDGRGPRTTLAKGVAETQTAQRDNEIVRAAAAPGYLIARTTGTHPKATVVLWPRPARPAGGGAAPQPAPAPPPVHHREAHHEPPKRRERHALPAGRKGRLRVAGVPTDATAAPVLTPGRVLLAGVLGAVTAAFATSGGWAAAGALAPIGMLLFADAAVKAGSEGGS